MQDFILANWQELALAFAGGTLVVAFLTTKRQVVNPIQSEVLEEDTPPATTPPTPPAPTGYVYAKKVPPGTQIIPAIVAGLLTAALFAAGIYFKPKTDAELRTERDTAVNEVATTKGEKVKADGKIEALEKQLKALKVTPVTVDISSSGGKASEGTTSIVKLDNVTDVGSALDFLADSATELDGVMGASWPRLSATKFESSSKPFSITIQAPIMSGKEYKQWVVDVEKALVEVLDAPPGIKVTKLHQVTTISRDKKTITRFRVVYDAELPASGKDPKQEFTKVVVALEPSPSSNLLKTEEVKKWAVRLGTRFQDMLDPSAPGVSPTWVPTSSTIPGVGPLLPAPGTFGKKSS